MSIHIRNDKFHYRFHINGVNYSGVCPGCGIRPGMSPKELAALRRKAQQHETAERERAEREAAERRNAEQEIRKNKSVVALIENYKYELTGGHPIRLAEAFPLAAAKPAKRKAKSSYANLRETYWNDFVQ